MKPDLFFAIVATIDMVPLAEQQKVDAVVNLIRSHVQMLRSQLDLLELEHKIVCNFQVEGSEPVNILLKEHKRNVKTSK